MLCPDNWRDYELIDSGEGQKLERWGQYVIARPEPRAIWNKGNPEAWKRADATFEGESWKFRSSPPQPWQIRYGQIVFDLKPTEFKHTGVFPEQAVNWDWLANIISGKNVQVLNLFAYTGGATMACALAGAHVTHVDASKPAMVWATNNARLAGIPKEKIRWIQEDALKFVEREQRRGVTYDGIIMDPPRFGRGAGGEVWKLEENLPKLVHEAKKILSKSPLFFLINAYTADLSHTAIKNTLEDATKDLGGKIESGEIGIKESGRERVMPVGIFARNLI